MIMPWLPQRSGNEDDDSSWTGGYGATISELNMHRMYSNEKDRCNCGEILTDEQSWNDHVNYEKAKSILINHARTEDGQCISCGKLSSLYSPSNGYSRSYSDHVLGLLIEANVMIMRNQDET